MDAIRSTWLYLKYGAGYRWSFSCNGSGKTPDSFIGRASKSAMDELNSSGQSFGKEIGYWAGGVPGVLIGEALYLMLGD
jgi:hypothetical protein